MADSITVTFERITPEMAAEWLTLDTDKARRIRASHVEFLTGVILRGEWQTIHQGIAFSDTGALLDGFHRLSAIVASKTAVQCMVTRGWDRVTLNVMDFGRPRSVGDIMRLSPNTIAIARMLWSLYNNNFNTTKATADQLAPILKWSEPFIKMVDDIGHSHKSKRTNAPAMMAAVVRCMHNGPDAILGTWGDYVTNAKVQSTAVNTLITRMDRSGSLTNLPISRWSYAARVWLMLDPKRQKFKNKFSHKDNNIKEIPEIQEMHKALHYALMSDQEKRARKAEERAKRREDRVSGNSDALHLIP